MNNFLRPSLYNADHEIFPVKKVEGKKYDIVGPIVKVAIFLKKFLDF